MSSESDFLRDLRDASIKTTVEYLRLVFHLQQRMLGGLAPGARALDLERGRDRHRGDGDEGEGRGRRARRPSSPADLLFDVARLQLSTYNNLLGLSSQYADRAIDGLRGMLGAAPGTSRPARHRQRILLSGHPGERVQGPHPIEIENRTSHRATVSLSASEFRPVAGGPPFGTAVEFHAAPPDRHLQPDEVRSFWVTVVLDPPFRADQHYDAEVYVVMGERMVEIVDLAVDVRPARP